jgi:hypothetical protein
LCCPVFFVPLVLVTAGGSELRIHMPNVGMRILVNVQGGVVD